MFGNIGVPERLAFSGIGKVVNTVTRVEQATKVLGPQVLALKSFTDAAPGTWVSTGEIEISDFDRNMEVFTLPEQAPVATGKSAGVERTPAE